MAKRIPDTNLFEPGVIYELQVQVDGSWHPFYVGETTNPEQRLNQHRWAAEHATEDSTLVYRTIRYQLEPAGCEWRMMTVHEYGAEGPEDAEDEHIMMLLRQNQILTNEKKGNANWMAERQAQAADMRQRGITSYKKYKEIVTQEAANARHAAWLSDIKPLDEHRVQATFILNNVRASVNDLAEERAAKAAEKAQRAAKREARVAAARAEQIAAWQANLDQIFGDDNEQH